MRCDPYTAGHTCTPNSNPPPPGHVTGFAAHPDAAPTAANSRPARHGLPVAPPRYRLIVIQTGEGLDTWDTGAEMGVCLAFTKLDADAAMIETGIPVMGSLTSW